MVEVLYRKMMLVLFISVVLCYGSKIKFDSKAKTEEKIRDNDNIAEEYKILTATGTIMIAGLGDRSFIITTLMATKYNKFIILLSAFSAMGIMSFFSVFLGEELPKYISYQSINYLAIFFFAFLGLKMINEGFSIPQYKEPRSKIHLSL